MALELCPLLIASVAISLYKLLHGPDHLNVFTNVFSSCAAQKLCDSKLLFVFTNTCTVTELVHQHSFVVKSILLRRHSIAFPHSSRFYIFHGSGYHPVSKGWRECLHRFDDTNLK